MDGKLADASRRLWRLDVGENVFEFEFWFVDFKALQAIAVFE